MIILFALLVIVLFFVIIKTQFFKKTKDSDNKFMTQLAMAILVGVVTMNTLFSGNETNTKYIVVGIGIMSFIVILFEAVVTKVKQIKA